jgi:hypothetical protein
MGSRNMPAEAHSSPTAARSESCPAQHPDAHFAALRARAAQAGYALMRTRRADGSTAFLASRWGLLRELADVTAAEDFLRRIGAPP